MVPSEGARAIVSKAWGRLLKWIICGTAAPRADLIARKSLDWQHVANVRHLEGASQISPDPELVLRELVPGKLGTPGPEATSKPRHGGTP